MAVKGLAVFVENPVSWASYPRINCDAIEVNVTHKL